MSTFTLVRLIHVISAVLGGGLVASVAIVAGRSTSESSPPIGLLARLTRWASLGLGATFVTGVALGFIAGAPLRERLWFRLAGLSMVVAAVLVGVLRRRVGKVASGAAEHSALRAVPWLAYAACAVVAWITALMELRPF